MNPQQIFRSFMRYAPPLRVTAVVFLVWTIMAAIQISIDERNGYETGLGGLLPFITGIAFLIAGFVDLVMSYLLRSKPELNYCIQLLLAIVFLLWFFWW